MAPKYAMAIGRVRDKGFRVTKHKAPVKPSRRKGVQHKVRKSFVEAAEFVCLCSVLLCVSLKKKEFHAVFRSLWAVSG